MAIDLKEINGLKEACSLALQQHPNWHQPDGWITRVEAWLKEVEAVDHDTFVSPQFQHTLWEGQTIAATGQGNIDVSSVIASADIAQELWELKQTPLPPSQEARTVWIGEAWEQITNMVAPHVSRTPLLKIYRVFASLWPEQFTTVAHYTRLRNLARAMGLKTATNYPTELHDRVLKRLDEAGVETSSREERMTLAWALIMQSGQERGAEPTELPGDSPNELRLNPLPAERRRRGMLGISGSVPSVIAMLAFAKDGCKRADLLEHIRSVNPKLATASLGTNLNALIAEWGALRSDGDDIFLTLRGDALLETGEVEEVSDWLLTQILGFDNLLYMLQEAPLQHKQAIIRLKRVNPGWTSNFAPTVLINWLKGMKLAEMDAAKVLRLTARGSEWASRIYWTPGELPPVAVDTPDPASKANSSEVDDLWSQLPSIQSIKNSFPNDVVFDRTLIAQLHAGLWNRRQPRRHFAVLTGLSGAGKTLLAMGYAKALWANNVEDQGEVKGWHVVAVQPGWHDPSSLLGYVNPIDNDVYMRTGFLDFLLRASADPDRPYIVLLDEMNLSHAEQYLAPLLSAMETGDDIELHALGDEVGDVPGRLPYPSNLVIIGTVNMDETTHGLSDKVLDRSTVIEFWDIDVNSYPGWASEQLPLADLTLVKDVLGQLMVPLRAVRLHFGWRTIGDVLGYVEAAVKDGELTAREALDLSVYAKVLPKLRGENSKRLCDAFDAVTALLTQYQLTRSAAKTKELSVDLREQGSARFWR
ncbi:McrB family protein [Stenotrophomonas sp. Ker107b]